VIGTVKYWAELSDVKRGAKNELVTATSVGRILNPLFTSGLILQ
jgi:hypothetical protein